MQRQPRFKKDGIYIYIYKYSNITRAMTFYLLDWILLYPYILSGLLGLTCLASEVYDSVNYLRDSLIRNFELTATVHKFIE